jgi:hypothetical protein
MATSSLSDLTKMTVMPKLPKTAALVQPKPTPEGMLGPTEVGPVLSELGSAESQAALAVGQRDIDIEQAKRDERATEARMKAENLGQFSQEIKAMPERATLEQAREDMSAMSFVPTKDNATDLAAMFSLINIVGMLVGKSDAQRSMYAMNGMLEGYQKGRADLYKKEQIEFDKNFKAMQAKVATLEKALTEAMEVKKYDKEKGDLMVTMALAESESPVLKAMRDRQGDVAVLENVRKARKDSEKGSYLNQVMSSEIPPELLQFLTKVRDIRNNYYLNISGKAVTGGEAARSYGAVPQPGDDAQGMLNKIGGMAKRVDDSIQLKRQLYGLPEINLREGARTNLAPGQDYSRDETQVQRRSFATQEEAEAANLDPGTKITINGRNATVE